MKDRVSQTTASFDPYIPVARAGAKNGQLVVINSEKYKFTAAKNCTHTHTVVVNNKLREDAVTDHCRATSRRDIVDRYMTCKFFFHQLN